MGKVRDVAPAALIAGIIFADEDVLERAKRLLEDEFGKIKFESAPFTFDMTDYYNAEMGGNLRKLFVCFEHPVELEAIPDIKLMTNDFEMRLAVGDPVHPLRRVNIDPGYVTLSKLVLVTTKDYSHRVYIGRGIFAETTLRYRGGTFEFHDTTYPDYRTPLALEFFNRVRDFIKRNEAVWTRKNGSKR